jgi:transaldolase
MRGATTPGFAPSDAVRDWQLFLDTADFSEYESLLPLGFFYGVTCNPAIMTKDGWPVSIESAKTLLNKVLTYPSIQKVFFQAWGDKTEDMVQRGLDLFALDPEHVVVKVPLTRAGMAAASELKKHDIPLCMTACHSAKQGLIAEGLGAEWIAPYVGKMDDLGIDGVGACETMHEALGGKKSKTRVQAASIRTLDKLMELSKKGLDTFTFSPAIGHALVDMKASDDAAAAFEVAVKNGPKK